ncbi:MAG: hypothetical protein J5758_01050, partial [Abditibacteriota bacterium]|nr:hypothetical protein [Abditibacteriota bacterium]
MRYLTLCALVALCLGACCFAQGGESAAGDTVWYDAAEAPMTLCGVLAPTEQEPYYHRLPAEVAESTSEAVVKLSRQTAGGRVRFVTDSPYITIRASFWVCEPLLNLTQISSAGFGIYIQKGRGPEKYYAKTAAAMGHYDGNEWTVYLPGGEQTVTIYMPLYGGVRDLHIGVKAGSAVSAAPRYRIDKPVVFYGSSITQGGCATRPGNSYQGMMARSMDMDYINLGFSGAGRGEQSMANYIAGLDLSAFVLDYDHNAPDPEHLLATHYNFYETVRRQHPDAPILMVSRPVIDPDPEEIRRRDIIRDSWQKAKRAGDKNVYFIDGSKFMTGYAADCWSVDGSHPNELGFSLMARAM